MDYGRIINRSFEIAWKYKSLWIFGVFAGSGYSNFYINTGKKMNMDPYFPSDLQNFHFPTELLGMFVLAILGMAVIFMVLNILARVIFAKKKHGYSQDMVLTKDRCMRGLGI